MPELTARAHDTSTAAVAYDGDVGDVKEDDIEALKIEALKIEEPTATIVSDSPIEPVSGTGVGILVHLLKAKDEIRRLEKENEELKQVKREIDETKKSAPPTESASPPSSASTKNVLGNRKIVVSHLYSNNLFKIPGGLDLEDKAKVEEW